MIMYFLKSGLLLLIFYAVYKLLLENERMFRFNRFYLLGSILFSLIIPLRLFLIESIFSTKIKIIQLDAIMIVTNKAILNKINYNEILMDFMSIGYAIIVGILAFRFVRNVYCFYERMKNYKVEIIDGQKMVLTEESILPHSFWNAVFVNYEDFKNGKIPSELIAHEKAHLGQKHTLDLLIVETLQILFWFNPIFILYKKAIKLNHEFLADEAVNKQFGEVRNYQNLLLGFASQKNTISLASNINYLITKKRLLMMTKKESPTKIILKICSVTAVYVLSLFAFNTNARSQSDNNLTNRNDDKINHVIANVKEPQFPGGLEKFYMFIGQNFKIPQEFSKQKIDGKLFMEFMIEKDGSLSEFKIVKDLGYGLGDEAMRVLKIAPKWIPASENGNPVRVMYSLPITIQAEK